MKDSFAFDFILVDKREFADGVVYSFEYQSNIFNNYYNI